MTEETNILLETKPTRLILSDGKEYTLSAITLTTLANIEDEFGCGIDKIQEQFTDRAASTSRRLLYALLKEGHPTLTLESVGKLVAVDKIEGIMNTILTSIGTVKA